MYNSFSGGFCLNTFARVSATSNLRSFPKINQRLYPWNLNTHSQYQGFQFEFRANILLYVLRVRVEVDMNRVQMSRIQ
jgi:hypothetical protein